MPHISMPPFHPGMLAQTLRGGVVEQTGPEGSAATRPVQPAPPAGLSGMGTWHIGPAGCREGREGDVRGIGALMLRGGSRCCAVRTVPQSVHADGIRCADGVGWGGGGVMGKGRGPRPGLQSQQCPVFPRRGRTCLPPAAARLECDVGAPAWGHGGCNHPPFPPPPGCVRGPGGSRFFLLSFLFLAPLLSFRLCPFHIFDAIMGDEKGNSFTQCSETPPTSPIPRSGGGDAARSISLTELASLCFWRDGLIAVQDPPAGGTEGLVGAPRVVTSSPAPPGALRCEEEGRKRLG